MASDLIFYRRLIALYHNLGQHDQVVRVKRELNQKIANHAWGE